MTQYPAAPPQAPSPGYTGYAAPPKKPAWPVVIGIISIVIGGLFSLCTCVGIPMNIAQRANPAVQELMEQFPEWWTAWQIIGGLLWLGLYILLLVAGICLVRRRAVGLPLHVTFALLGLIWCIINGVVTFRGMAGVELPAPMGASMKPFMLIGMFAGFVFGGAYPIFLLVWFSRPGIRQQVQSWRLPPGGATPYQHQP